MVKLKEGDRTKYDKGDRSYGNDDIEVEKLRMSRTFRVESTRRRSFGRTRPRLRREEGGLRVGDPKGVRVVTNVFDKDRYKG